jgi:AraC-like DNA-binding protein
MRTINLAEIEPVVRIANCHAVAPGQSWPNRRIPDLQLIFILQGEYEYLEAEQSPIQVHPGEVLLIEPSHRHTFRRADTLDAGAISGLHCELVPSGTWAAGDYRLVVAPERVTRVVDAAYLQERFKRLAFVYNSYLPYRERQTSAIAHEIILIVASHWQQPPGTAISPRIQEMIKFIRTNLQQPLSRQILAQAFGVSPEHVNLLFRKELGMTPSAVINRERVMLAYRLIHEKGYTVKEAAHEAGYSDPFYFSRVFKNVLGVPPSQVA